MLIQSIDSSRRIQVYRNLHKPGCQYSVRLDGRVRGYVDRIVLSEVRFKHATARQLAEVRSGARQVCQWVSGYLLCNTPSQQNWEVVEADPKRHDGFVLRSTGQRIDKAAFAIIDHEGLRGAVPDTAVRPSAPEIAQMYCQNEMHSDYPCGTPGCPHCG